MYFLQICISILAQVSYLNSIVVLLLSICIDNSANLLSQSIMVQELIKPKESVDLVEAWFDDFVGTIRAEQVQLQTSLASKEKKDFWSLLISGNQNEILHQGRTATSIHFIQSIILEFLTELNESDCKPLKLAFDLSDAKVLVWAEISDDDELTEDKILLAEAKVNAHYYKYGFHISSTILECSDRYPVPSHYKSALPN